MCRLCLCQRRCLQGLSRLLHTCLDVLKKALQKQLCRHMAIIYGITFLLILPVVCHQLKFSIYHIRPKTERSQEEMRRENTKRIDMANRYFQMLNATKIHRMLSSEVHNTTGVDIALTVITVSRNRHRLDSYEPKYLTQVMWQLLAQLHAAQAEGFPLHVHLAICNVDHDPESYKEALRLAPMVPVFRRFNKLSLTLDTPLEKEKKDYVYCLNSSLGLNPRYVLLMEDDALPHDDFFRVLEHMVRTQLDHYDQDGSLVTNKAPGAYIKLYHPERLLGYISLEAERLPELLSVGLVVATIGAVAYLAGSKGGRATTWTGTSIWPVWLCFFAYGILVALAVGRANLIELRRLWSPHLYTLVRAPECCTPAMLFPRDGAVAVAGMLQRVRCKNGFGKDMALWKWRRQHSIPAYMVQPNMVTHIGLYSALRTAILDPFIV